MGILSRFLGLKPRRSDNDYVNGASILRPPSPLPIALEEYLSHSDLSERQRADLTHAAYQSDDQQDGTYLKSCADGIVLLRWGVARERVAGFAIFIRAVHMFDSRLPALVVPTLVGRVLAQCDRLQIDLSAYSLGTAVMLAITKSQQNEPDGAVDEPFLVILVRILEDRLGINLSS